MDDNNKIGQFEILTSSNQICCYEPIAQNNYWLWTLKHNLYYC